MSRKRDGRRHKFRNLLPILGIILGLCILGAYPALDLYYAAKHAAQGKHIQQAVSSMSHDEYAEYEKQAKQYNDGLFTHSTPDGTWPYNKQLSVEGEGKPFAELVIPKISLDMLIYHGTSEQSLMNGVGHLEGTSLPIGGKNTHSVLTAHSGMDGMRAFDDIRQMKKGDTFLVKVLGKTIAYKVYKIEVVWPDEADTRIFIEKDKDLCTLITCTPYGVNDHRLLVHGKRVPYKEKMAKEKPSVQQIVTNRRYGPFIIVALIILLSTVAGAVKRHRKKEERGQTK